MNENGGQPDSEQGLYRKYNVERVSDPTGKHKDCTYYVLDLDHDPHSVAALLAYAESCKDAFPTLAFALRHMAAATARKLNVSAPAEEAPSQRFNLSPQELADLCTFSFGMSCDAPEDAAEVVIGHLSEHENGPGWYVWCGEYPEEGSVPIHKRSDGPSKP